jgi:hypothetical protein
MTNCCRSLGVLAVFAAARAAFGVDVTRPGDFIVGSSENYPAGEAPFLAIDNTATTKYLNFDELNTGFTVTPSGTGLVNYITIVTANDAPPRDPTSFTLEGSDDGVGFTRIASGALTPTIDRFSISSSARFTNTTSYVMYRVLFPTVRDPDGANSMQVAEVQLATGIDITSPEDQAGLVIPKISFTDPGEGVERLFDNNLGTKLRVQNFVTQEICVEIWPLAGSTVLNGLSYFSANDDANFPGRTPQNITIYGSNDGVNSTQIFTTPLAQATDNFQDQEFDFANTTAYTQYAICLGAPFSGQEMQIGDLQLFGTANTMAPPNDDCANATALSYTTISGTTAHATGTDITACGDGDATDVWYSYTAPASGMVEINTCFSTRDTTLAVYTTCNGTAIACDDNGCFAQSIVRFHAVANQTYLVRVALSDGETGRFVLTVNGDPAEHTDTSIALNYNFNGLTHAGEELNPDDPDGYRSISDRGLAIDGNADSIGVGTIIGNSGITYSVVQDAGAFDIVHLGDRNTVDNGNWAFDLKADGDNIGTQPTWLANSDQSGPQTTDVTGITFTPVTRVGLLYQVSNGGGFFDFTLAFTDGTSVTVQLEAPDWFFYQSPVAPGFGVERQGQLGVFRGTENVDNANVGASLNVFEAIVSVQSLLNSGFGDFSGRELDSITFSGRTNFIAGYAMIAATVRDATVVDECAADFNNDDLVNSQDFFDFLTAFFATAPNADFNGDMVINSQDFFDFLKAFFAGC